MADRINQMDAVSSTPQAAGQNDNLATEASNALSAHSKMWSDVLHGRSNMLGYGMAAAETLAAFTFKAGLAPFEVVGDAAGGAILATEKGRQLAAEGHRLAEPIFKVAPENK